MILAVESSCDETALALVTAQGRVVFNKCSSQIALHNQYGGVVPELASRAHFGLLEELSGSLLDFMGRENIQRTAISSIAATMGPGLVGPLLVGSSFARGLSAAWQVPFIGVHHLRAHVAAALLAHPSGESLEKIKNQVFPATVLLVSGGHCLLLRTDEQLNFTIKKTTSDDSAGECFDKCAKLLGLDYPGGPALQTAAQKCNSPKEMELAKVWSAALPRPKSAEGFSFAGLKTAFRLLIAQDPRAREMVPAAAWAIQSAIIDSLLSVIDRDYRQDVYSGNFIVCGGVAANLELKNQLANWCTKHNLNFLPVPLEFATDNAPMVATAAWIQGIDKNISSVFARGNL